jgi:hypothetical protein
MDWGLMTGGTDIGSVGATGGDDAGFRWTFAKTSPRIVLSGAEGGFLVVRIRDVLSGLTYQRMAIQGIQR